MLLPAIGTFIIACGSSALNHFQEKDYDPMMKRTENRPLASGKLSAMHGLIFSLVLIIGGYLFLEYLVNSEAAVLGLFAVILYNVIYTPLKRITTLAVFPGALVGAVPPMIGWAAVGLPIYDPTILALGFFIFIWQMPHFWLLVLIYDEEYRMAGYPVLTDRMDKKQLRRITYVWIFALATSCMLFPMFRISYFLFSNILFVVLGIALVWRTRILLIDEFDKKLFRKTFLGINLYVLSVLIILTIDRLILI